MVVGTFNLVMAERLVRKVCDHCTTTISVKEDPKYLVAKQSLKNFDKEALKTEIAKRGINQEQRNTFVNEGIIHV